MQTFLQQIIQDVRQKNLPISNLCFVFPTRRASLFFKKYLSETIDKPIWSPEILSIQDFYEKFSDRSIPDKLTLIMELYNAHRQAMGPEEPFDKFFSWGEMLLRDFNDIDKYLVDPDKLFSNIKDLKQIEEDFNFAAADAESFAQFWKTISNTPATGIKSSFLGFWEKLPEIYKAFHGQLSQKKLGYEGLLEREILQKLQNNELELPWQQVIFAGFNALTRAEEQLISLLLKKEKLTIYWDSDHYFLEDEFQEAGHFHREYRRKWRHENSIWFFNDLRKREEPINVYATPLKIAQTQLAGQLLQEHSQSRELNLEETAIVLPDEGLLFPALHSLPAAIEDVNITMGFPFKNSSLYALLEALIRLQNNIKKGRFYYLDVVHVLRNPHIKIFNPEAINNFLNDLEKQNLIYLSAQMIKIPAEPDIFSNIFQPLAVPEVFFPYLKKLLLQISEKTKETENLQKGLDLENIYHAYTQLTLLEDATAVYQIKLQDNAAFRSLFREVMKSVKIPFSGEPLKGLQIMGLLETRALDFKNLFVLSMNEGLLPDGSAQNSFLPYNIRKAFGLPTYREQDSIYAYHFYRLIHRAENVHLFYSTDTGTGSGEQSRYLLQLKYELGDKVQEHLLSTQIEKNQQPEISVPKEKAALESLNNYFEIGFVSPTALSSYITCPLQFYFRYVAGLKEQEMVPEELEAGPFGNIYHQAMQQLYEGCKNVPLTAEIFQELKNKIPAAVEAALKEEGFENLAENLQGKNILLKSVIEKLVRETLIQDEFYNNKQPFTIHAAEQQKFTELPLNGFKVRIGGTIDRIDRLENGALRIVDYKTGKVKTDKKTIFDNREEYLDQIFTNPEYKAHFQSLLYAWLYQKENPGAEIQVAIYPLKNIRSGMYALFNGDALEGSFINEFEERLTSLLQAILETNLSFSQTADKENCLYCPYNTICQA